MQESNFATTSGDVQADLLAGRRTTLVSDVYMKPEIIDVWNNCSVSLTQDICEVYVAARSHSLPTPSEEYETCKALGPGWELDPDQSGVRTSFVRCIRQKIPASESDQVK
jgi:hypothetical protein